MEVSDSSVVAPANEMPTEAAVMTADVRKRPHALALDATATHVPPEMVDETRYTLEVCNEPAQFRMNDVAGPARVAPDEMLTVVPTVEEAKDKTLVVRPATLTTELPVTTNVPDVQGPRRTTAFAAAQRSDVAPATENVEPTHDPATVSPPSDVAVTIDAA